MGLLGFHWALAGALNASARARAVNRLFNNEGMDESLVGIARPTGRDRIWQCTATAQIVIDHACQGIAGLRHGPQLSDYPVPQQGFALGVMAAVDARRLSVLLPVGPAEMRQ